MRLEDAAVLALKMKEGDHEPRNAGSLYNLEKTRKQILPWSLQKECSPQTP